MMGAGERYFSARIVQKMDRLMRSPELEAPRVSVPVIALTPEDWQRSPLRFASYSATLRIPSCKSLPPGSRPRPQGTGRPSRSTRISRR